jgi:hypothetical protein
MSSVGNVNVAFWAVCDEDESLDAVAEIVIVPRRARFRDITGVDMKASSEGQRILRPRCSDGSDESLRQGAHKDMAHNSTRDTRPCSMPHVLYCSATHCHVLYFEETDGQ